MNAIVEIDKAGRIIIPKKMRDLLHLTPGTRLRIERHQHQIRIEPDVPEPHVEIREGFPVLVGGPPLAGDDVNRAIEEAREQRMRFIAGLSDEP